MATDFTSVDVVSGADILATDLNNLRDDTVRRAGDYEVSAGSDGAYTLAIDSSISAYADGLIVRFKSNHANTGAATININSIGAADIKRNVSEDLRANDIISGQAVTLQYDSTTSDFQMISQPNSLHDSLQSTFGVSAPSVATSVRFGQITTNPDGSKMYLTYASGTEPNTSVTVVRYDRDAITGMYYFVSSTSLAEGVYGSKDGDQAGICAGDTYVWVAFKSDNNTDIMIVRLDDDLANPQIMTISGAAAYIDVNCIAGDDAKIWVCWDQASTTVGYYTISGTTATVGSNITIAENTDDVAGFFYDATDLIVQDNTGGGNIIRYNTSGVSQATIDANFFVNGLDESEPRGSLFGIGYHTDNSIWMLGVEGLADAANDIGMNFVGRAVSKP